MPAIAARRPTGKDRSDDPEPNDALDRATQTAFLELKPLCVSLLDHEGWTEGKHVATLQAIAVKLGRLSSGEVDRLADYVFFPLLRGLQLPQARERAVEGALLCIAEVLSNCSKGGLRPAAFAELVQSLPFVLLHGHVVSSRAKEPLPAGGVAEAVQLATLTCLGALSSNDFSAQWAALAVPAASGLSRGAAVVGHVLFAALTTAKAAAPGSQVQREALEMIEALVARMCDAGARSLLVQIVPGILSGVCRIATSKPGLSHAVVCPALETFRLLLLAVFAVDEVQPDAGDPLAAWKPVKAGLENANSPDWEKLASLYNQMSALRQHPHDSVRLAMVMLDAAVAATCRAKLPELSADAVRMLAAAATDESALVRDAAHKAAISDAWVLTETQKVAAEGLGGAARALARNGASEASKSMQVAALVGSLRVAPNVDLLALRTQVELDRSGSGPLLEALRLESDGPIVESGARAALPAGLVPLGSLYRYFPRRTFAHWGEERTESLVRGLLRTWARGLRSGALSLAGGALEQFHRVAAEGVRGDGLAAAALLLNETLVGAGTVCGGDEFGLGSGVGLGSGEELLLVETAATPPPNDTSLLARTITDAYVAAIEPLRLELEMGATSAGRSGAAQTLSLIMEGLAAAALCVPAAEAEQRLQRVLLPVFALQLVPSHIVAVSAETALRVMAAATGCDSPRSLVLQNLDYVVTSARLGLRNADTRPLALLALEAALRIGGVAAAEHLEDPLFECARLVEPLCARDDRESGFLVERCISVCLAALEVLGSARVSSSLPVVESAEIPQSLRQFIVSYEATRAARAMGPLELDGDQVIDGHGTDASVQDAPVEFGMNDDDAESPRDSESEDDADKELPLNQRLAVKALRSYSALLSHESPNVRVRVLRILERGLPILQGGVGEQFELLPLLHDVWLAVVARVQDEERPVVLQALDLVAVMVQLGRDFMTRKVMERLFVSLERVVSFCVRLEMGRAPVPLGSSRRAGRAVPSSGSNSSVGAVLDWVDRQPGLPVQRLPIGESLTPRKATPGGQAAYRASYLYNVQVRILRVLRAISENVPQLRQSDARRLVQLLVPYLDEVVFVRELCDQAVAALSALLRPERLSAGSGADEAWFALSVVTGRLLVPAAVSGRFFGPDSVSGGGSSSAYVSLGGRILDGLCW